MDRRSVLTGMAGLGIVARAHAQEGAGDCAESAAMVGAWGGVLKAGSQRLRLKLVVEADDACALSVAMYSLDQGDVRIPGEQAKFNDGRFTAQFPSVRGSMDLALTDDGALDGEWRQGAAMPLRLTKDPDFDAMLGDTQIGPLTAESLAALREEAGSPGLAAAARGPGGELMLADGVRSANDDIAVTVNDQWHIGSITKSMTATVIARLVEAGTLAWDTGVGAALGDIAPDARDQYADVTLKHLLSHRAGLPANLPIDRLLSFPRHQDDARESRIAYVAEALAAQPVGPKEETFEYSNSGYVIAGVIAERTLDMRFEDIMRRELFEPLGMDSAGFGAPGTAGELDQPIGHAQGLLSPITGRRQPFGLDQEVTDNPEVMGPAGRAHMTLADLLIYLAAHRDRTSLLGMESWRTLHTPPYGGDYAMGWIVRSDGALWHNGSNTLWYAEALFNPTTGVVAAAAANDGHMPQAAPAVGEALAGAITAVSGTD